MPRLFVKTPNGKTIPFDVDASDTFDAIQSKIKDHIEGNSYDYCFLNWEHIPKPAPKWLWQAGSMQIFVRILHEEKTISLPVESSDTICALKVKIDRMEGIYPFEQRIFYAGELLDNDSTLAYYNIFAGFSLDLVLESKGGLMNICVETTNGNTIPLKANRNDTIMKVKALIHQQLGIPLHQQKLVYAIAGDSLDDTKLLANYYINNLSTLRLVDHDPSSLLGQIGIHVKFAATGKSIRLYVESTDTIHTVKAKIQAEENIPTTQQILYLPQKRLQDAFTLADYYIQNETTLHLAQTLGQDISTMSLSAA